MLWLPVAAPSAGAAPGDASASAVLTDFTATPTATGIAVVVDTSLGVVSAPPDSTSSLTDQTITGDFGPDIGIVDVVRVGALKTTSSSDSTGAAATSVLTTISFPTPAGLLVIDTVGSAVSCPDGGTPTAEVTQPALITLDGVPQAPLDPTAPTTIPVPLPPEMGTFDLTLTANQTTATAAGASATGLVLTLQEDLTGFIVAGGTATFGAASCETPLPTITSLTPTRGPQFSGTTVTVTGTGFVPGQTTVNIGGQQVPANVNTPTELTFFTPGGLPPGVVPVSVTTPAGTTGTLDFTVNPPLTTSGTITLAETGAPLQRVCLVYSPVANPGQNTYQGTNGNGTWSFTTDQPGPFNIGFYAPPVGSFDCGDAIDTTPVPAWYGNAAMTGTDPRTTPAPAGAAAVPAGSGGIAMCLGRTALPTDGCAQPTTELSGRVFGAGGAPLGAACIYIVGDPDTGVTGPILVNTDGTWSASGLPINTDFVVAFLPLFQGEFGPCADDGPPPAPPAGELQPAFYGNVWINFADETLFNDPRAWGVARGATIVRGSATGIDGCITNAPGDQLPRTSCAPPAPSTTETSAPTPSSSTSMPPTSAGPTPGGPTTAAPALANTGAPVTPTIGVAAGAVLLGLALLFAARRRRTTPSPRHD